MADGVQYEPIAPGRDMNGVGPNIGYAREAASQDFVKGAAVDRVSGFLEEASTDPATIPDGFADEAGSDTATDGEVRTRYNKNTKGKRFIGSLLEALADTTEGTDVGVVKDVTTGIWYFSTAATNKYWTVEHVDRAKWTNGDLYAVVEVEVK
jgi:hypothetical protein